MSNHSNRRPGQPPGVLRGPGESRGFHSTLSVMDYSGEQLAEVHDCRLEDVLPYRDVESTTWIDVCGIDDHDTLRALGDHFGIHALVLEDIANPHQRPKFEDMGAYLFIVARMLTPGSRPAAHRSQQVSMIVTPWTLLTFREHSGDVFEPVRNRVRNGVGRLRNWGTGYLAYALLDAIVDHFFPVIDETGEEIEELEEAVLRCPEPSQGKMIHRYKREMVRLRRSITPLREVLSSLQRTEAELLDDRLRPFLRDVYDHTIQAVEGVETYRDLLSGIQDLYLASVSNRMNEVMKVLTVAATIFVPLTFLTGVYGMNFQYIPELAWKWSYPMFWLVSLVVGGGLFAWFKKRRYL